MFENSVLYIGIINLFIIIFLIYGGLQIGKSITDTEESDTICGVPFGIPIILTLLSSISAFFLVGYNTILIVAFLILFLYLTKFKILFPKFKEFYSTLYFFLPYYLILFLIRSNSFFQSETGIVNSSSFDDYSYTSQINLLLKIKKETWFLELERGVFSMDVAFKPYHYFEFYLSALFKYLVHQSSYVTYHLSTIPILQTLALGTGTLAVRKFSKWKDSQVLILCLSMFLCLRYTILDELVFQELSMGLKNIFKHIVFQKVFLNQAGIHYLASYFGFKVSISLIFFCPLIIYLRKYYVNKLVLLSIIPVISITYAPFLIVFCVVEYLFFQKNFKSLIPILALIPIYIFYRLNGSDEIHGDKLDIINLFIEFNIKNFQNIFLMISDSFVSILESTYLLLVIASILILYVLQTKIWIKILMFLFFGFPFFIYEKGIGLYVFISILFLTILFYIKNITSFLSRNNLISILISIVILYLTSILFCFIWDIGQIFGLIFFAIAPVILIMSISQFPIKNEWIFITFGLVFLSFNIFNLYYDANRSLPPVITKALDDLKIKKWLTAMPNHKAAHFNTVTNPPFLGSTIVGNDFLNYSDSLVNTYLSLNYMTKSDSSIIRRSAAFSYFRRLPFVDFYEKQKTKFPERSLESLQIQFIKEQDIRLIFKADIINFEDINFLKNSIIDSLRVENKKYSCFLIDPKKL